MDSSASTFLTTTTSVDQSSRNPPKPKKKKTTSSTNKSIKVRYISNPMRVKTCASKFRELVQELTGQDAVDLQLEEEPVFSPSAVSDQTLSPPPPTTENLAPLHQAPFDERLVDCYEPLDGEEMFLPDHMSAGFSGFYSNGFYNVNDFGRIDST